MRLTKHSGQGHEDIEYSYVVVRRGERPAASASRVGRIGDVGKRAIEKDAISQAPIKELMLHSDHEAASNEMLDDHTSPTTVETISDPIEPQSQADVDVMLRLEAYSWPRLIFRPLKRSGHIILDGCTAEGILPLIFCDASEPFLGKIMRMTVPKSQGKQPFYDARKSAWGDLFPHEPKNEPQERYQPPRKTKRRNDDVNLAKGSDIGKRKGSSQPKDRLSYTALGAKLKETRKKSKRDRAHATREIVQSEDEVWGELES